MALTLTEQAKLKTNPLQAGIIEVFPKSSPVLERLPFMKVNSNSYTYNLEDTLPGIAFRDFGEEYSESTGVVNPATEVLKMFGGDSDVDVKLVASQGSVNDVRAVHDYLKAKAAALFFTRRFFKGDTATEAKGIDGLQKRLTGAQVISMSDAAGGAALTLDALDTLIDGVVGGPDVLFMNKAMRRKINKLIRAAGQATEVVSDTFGRHVQAYAGIPFGLVDVDNEGNEIFAFDEADANGDPASCCSIYAAKFGEKEYVSGLQCGEFGVEDCGKLPGFNFYRTKIDWMAGIAVFNPKAAARLMAIKNA